MGFLSGLRKFIGGDRFQNGLVMAQAALAGDYDAMARLRAAQRQLGQRRGAEKAEALPSPELEIPKSYQFDDTTEGVRYPYIAVDPSNGEDFLHQKQPSQLAGPIAPDFQNTAKIDENPFAAPSEKDGLISKPAADWSARPVSLAKSPSKMAMGPPHDSERAERARRRFAQRLAPGVQPPPATPLRRGGRHIAELSERYEGSRGPGTVAHTPGDRGGSSYGLPQLATNLRQPQAFLANEGRRWRARFGSSRPGTPEFDRAWATIGSQESEAFGEAQRAYISRTHYLPAVHGAFAETGMNLDRRSDAVRAAAWSAAVNHFEAPTILADAIAAADRSVDRASPHYDAELIKQIYGRRTRYVKDLSLGPGVPAQRRQLYRNMVENRFATEPADAMGWLPGGR